MYNTTILYYNYLTSQFTTLTDKIQSITTDAFLQLNIEGITTYADKLKTEEKK